MLVDQPHAKPMSLLTRRVELLVVHPPRRNTTGQTHFIANYFFTAQWLLNRSCNCMKQIKGRNHFLVEWNNYFFFSRAVLDMLGLPKPFYLHIFSYLPYFAMGSTMKQVHRGRKSSDSNKRFNSTPALQFLYQDIEESYKWEHFSQFWLCIAQFRLNSGKYFTLKLRTLNSAEVLTWCSRADTISISNF